MGSHIKQNQYRILNIGCFFTKQHLFKRYNTVLQIFTANKLNYTLG